MSKYQRGSTLSELHKPSIQSVVEGVLHPHRYYSDTQRAAHNKWVDEKNKYIEFMQNRFKNNGLTLPGSNYIGPGNSLPNGPPLHGPDIDAETHDKEYNIAKSHQEIQESDIKLLSNAGDHIAEGISGKGSISDSIYSTITGIGIGGKYLTEKLTGPIYPHNFSGKQWHIK